MDSLQEQVNSLNERVDALHQVIERLSGKISELLTQVKLPTGTTGSYRLQSGVSAGRYSYHGSSESDLFMEHKDVLMDTTYPETDSHSGERSLSPEVQIQRLTAQLTAAYNRIAALEEQLLAHRMH